VADVGALNLSVGERLAVLRKRAGLNQEALADLLGTSRPVISCIENGSRHLTLANAIKVATFFDVSLDALTGRESNGRTDSPPQDPRVLAGAKALAQIEGAGHLPNVVEAAAAVLEAAGLGPLDAR
jgi:transcriptional regulator with XRE-family HTH domain